MSKVPNHRDECLYRIVFVWEGEYYSARFNADFRTDFVSFLEDLGKDGRRDLESVLRINYGFEFKKGNHVNPYQEIFEEVEAEAVTGHEKYGAFNSAHEGFAVLLEEVDELKAHVWTKQKNRDLGAMRREAIQVAAMAVRFASELCTEERGRA